MSKDCEAVNEVEQELEGYKSLAQDYKELYIEYKLLYFKEVEKNEQRIRKIQEILREF